MHASMNCAKQIMLSIVTKREDPIYHKAVHNEKKGKELISEVDTYNIKYHRKLERRLMNAIILRTRTLVVLG